jgi:hypothetical protein
MGHLHAMRKKAYKKHTGAAVSASEKQGYDVL